MKLFALALTLVLSVPAFAAKSETERKITVLGKMAFGAQTHKVRAENAEEMVIKLAMKNRAESRKEIEETFTRHAKAKDLSLSEMPGWGTLSATEAAGYFGELQIETDDNGNEKDNSKQIDVGRAIIRELGKMGMKFGFTDGSSGYCGVSFGGLLVVDEEEENVYEIALTPSGSC